MSYYLSLRTCRRHETSLKSGMRCFEGEVWFCCLFCMLCWLGFKGSVKKQSFKTWKTNIKMHIVFHYLYFMYTKGNSSLNHSFNYFLVTKKIRLL